MEDGLHLMEATMDPIHAVVLADVFTEVDQAAGDDPEAEFLEDLATDRIGQGLTMLLPSPGQDQELALIRPDPDHQEVFTAENQGPGRGPHGRLSRTR
jgi:hypothetical protein